MQTKKLISLIAVVAVMVLLIFTLMPKNERAPSFQLPALTGQTVSDAHLDNKVTLINFWFPTCPGCASEMPKLIKMSHDYQGKDFQILSIAVPTNNPADNLDGVQSYAAKYQLPFPVMFDANKAAVQQYIKTEVYPTSFLINKRGEILKTFVGEPDFAQLYQEVDSELAK